VDLFVWLTNKTMANSNKIRIREGAPFPGGATWDGKGTNFALFSAHTTKVEVCLFDDKGARELDRIELPEHPDQIWHGYLADIRLGTIYGSAFMDHENRNKVIVSTPTSFCSTLTLAHTGTCIFGTRLQTVMKF
jgi:pullulanase/glycogen debranching enzyme